MKNKISEFFDKFSESYEDLIFDKSLCTKFCSNIEIDFINKIDVHLKDKVLDVNVGAERIASIFIKKV